MRGCGSDTLISLNIRPGLLPDAVAHQHRLFDVVSHQNDALDGHPALRPQIQEIGAQRLGGEHVQRGKWLIHEQNIRMNHERAGEPHALPHAARKLTGIGGLKSVQANEIDRRQGPFADIRSRHSLRLEAERNVLEHGQPRKQSEALKYHGDAGRRAGNRLAQVAQVTRGRLRQSGNQPQQRRLARTGSPKQPHDLALSQLEIHALEHQQFRSVGLGERLAHIVALQ